MTNSPLHTQDLERQVQPDDMPAVSQRKPVCVVVGAGPGNGAAFVRRFAAEGYSVAMLARTTEFMQSVTAHLPTAHAYVCDAGDAIALANTFASIETQLGAVDVLIYNAGKGVWGSAEEVSPTDFETSWRTNTLGAYIAAQSVIPAMKRRGAGQIVFIGATASRRGGARAVAFASAKAAQRSLAQSIARLLGPVGIHVSLVIVDGVVDEPLMRAKLADKPDSYFTNPDDIADTVVMLTRQKPSAWTFELEVRSFAETW
jgi:NAD(P)-dependent dehydrogenase (short-subunit alcohol dehydrogenase family)